MKHLSILAVILALFATSASAIQVIPYSLEKQTEEAEFILSGKIIKVEDVAAGTEYTMEVSEALKGSVGAHFTFILYGSRSDTTKASVKKGYRVARRVAGMPILKEGFEGILFLSGENKKGIRGFIGFQQGIYKVEKGQVKNLLQNRNLSRTREPIPLDSFKSSVQSIQRKTRKQSR